MKSLLVYLAGIILLLMAGWFMCYIGMAWWQLLLFTVTFLGIGMLSSAIRPRH